MTADHVQGEPKISFRPQGWFGRSLDYCLQPVMYWLQGNWHESPQRTHRWNNVKFRRGELDRLEAKRMVTVDASLEARPAWQAGCIPRFHLPRFGGWRDYLVLQPVKPYNEWYVGWRTPAVHGLSIVPLTGQVRVLRGPFAAAFFGLDPHGHQITIACVGIGTIGQGGINAYGVPVDYGNVPLR